MKQFLELCSNIMRFYVFLLKNKINKISEIHCYSGNCLQIRLNSTQCLVLLQNNLKLCLQRDPRGIPNDTGDYGHCSWLPTRVEHIAVRTYC